MLLDGQLIEKNVKLWTDSEARANLVDIGTNIMTIEVCSSTGWFEQSNQD